MKRLLDYMMQRARGLKNLACLTGAEATAELIDAFKPDLVVWSVGSRPLLPPIPGLHEQLFQQGAKVFDVEGFLENLDRMAEISGSRIALAGGGAVALDIAEFFAENNNQVSIVEQLPELGTGLDRFSKGYIVDLLCEKNTEILTSCRLEELQESAFLLSQGDTTKLLPFDYGFICLGLRSNAQPLELRQHLEEQGIPFVSVGDSKRARRIYEGIAEGRNITETLKLLSFYD